MDANTNYDASSLHSEFNKSSKSFKTSSGGDTIRDSESSGMILARYELDVTYICEKVTNLSLLLMRVETKETDFEAFVSDTNPDSVIKALLEYALLSGFLNTEVSILETQISDLQIEKANVREFLSSRKHLGEPLVEIEEMLHDSEKSLEQSLEQLLEIKIRSANFERNLLKFTGDDDYTESSNSNDPLELKENLKMQTVEHQKHILRMLEKSLEREIDLEKRVSELTQIEDTLTMRIHLLEQDFSYAEEEAETTLKKFYETDNTSDILMETSKDLINKIKMLQFNLKGSVQREAELKSSLIKLEERVNELKIQPDNEKESSKQIVEMENIIKGLRQQIVNSDNKSQEVNEKMISLEKELSDTQVKLQHFEACYEANEEEKKIYISTIKDMNHVIDDMKKKVTEAGKSNEKESSKQIVEMENIIKDLRQQIINSDNKSQEVNKKMVSLEKELNDTKVKLQHFEACYEANEEEKNMFISTISDMNHVIDDMKKKLTEAGIQTENMEDRCILLSESNAELIKEVNSVRARINCLENSLHKMEETKKASVKDINLRSKLITDLVMQMALERERLQKQISSLKQENGILVKHLKKIDEVSGVKLNDVTVENKETVLTDFEVQNEWNEAVVDPTETVRNIDARQLKAKDILKVILILIVPLLGVLVYQTQVR